jgi:hypothetical protein
MKLFFKRLYVGLVICLAALMVVSGCEAAKNRKAASEEVSINSYTTLLSGYRQTVTVKASVEELLIYISQPGSVAVQDVEFGESFPAAGEEAFGPGMSFLFTFRMGVVVPGRMIAIKLDLDGMWWAQDHTRFSLQQWDFAPAEDGIRVTFKTLDDVPDAWWVPLIEMMLEREYWYENSDLLLAGIQAHFDPSLDAQELVSYGIRGEAYQTLLQVHETSIWVRTPPEEVGRYLASPVHLAPLVGESKDGCLSRDLPDDRVLYCIAEAESAGHSLTIENFGIAHVEDKKLVRRIYQVALGLVGYVEVTLKPEMSGTRIIIELNWEMPDSMSPDGMEQALFLATLPRRLQDTASGLKTRLAATP